MKKTIITIIILVAIATSFYFILQSNKEKNDSEVAIVAQTNSEVAVRVSAVKMEEISEAFSVNGSFIPKTTAEVSAEVGGQLIDLKVEEGSVVKAGQAVAQIATDRLDINVSNAKANLDNAKLTLERYEAAHKTGGITTAQLDQAKLQVENAKAQYESAKLNSGDTRVITKVSGVVNVKKVEVGAVVNPGAPILEVVDISSLKLRVEVDEVLVSKLTVGQEVTLVPRATNEELTGKITFIAPASNGALKFPVEITVDNSAGQLRAGMYATAKFASSASKQTLTIPREAFVGSVSNNEVFVVKNGTAQMTKIKSGINYGDKVEVISGLNQGDQVVTSGQINLTNEAKVKIIK